MASKPLRSASVPLAVLLAATAYTLGCKSNSDEVQAYRVVNTYEHDPYAYCQGLLFADGALYESTGRKGTSSVRRVKLETGEIEQRIDLPPNLFGEGLALHNDELYQLTWTAGRVHVFDRATLKVNRNLKYEGEGWGLTSDGTSLLMSNGSNVISVREPATFEEIRRIEVTTNGKPVGELNELEYIEGELWANVWKYDHIVRIDPATGNVKGWIDLRGIFDRRTLPDPDSVLNGIAYDPQTKRIFVTGKLWPRLFEIEVVDK